jgi:hypothetical protein
MQDVRDVVRIHASRGLLVFAAAAALIGLFTAGCSMPVPVPSENAGVAEGVTVSATVQAVDLEKRLVTLKREDGSTFTVEAGPAVRNLPQLAAGDTVALRYVESVFVALKKPGDPVAPPEVSLEMRRAELGATPGGTVARDISATVKIESVDTAKHIVVFTAPDGALRAITVKRPTFQEYIKGLKPGDQVEITYTEAVAISVEKQPPAKQ